MGHQGEGLSKKTLTHSQCLIFKNLKDEKKKKELMVLSILYSSWRREGRRAACVQWCCLLSSHSSRI